MLILYGIGVILFTIILNTFFERYIMNNTDDLLLYVKGSYKDKSLILINFIELILGLIVGFNTFFVFYYFVIFILYKICEIDIKTKTIDNKLFIILIILAAMSTFISNTSVISDKILTCVTSLILFVLLSKVTRNGFGMGDAKVIGVLGFILGLQGLMAVLIISSILVFIVGIIMIIKSFSNRKKDLPFTPFMLFSVILLLIANNM
ncbi:A24 family peptidase [uncultured Clostridium sp.]|uniref:prepilin peptidase n=1 Tax=uncultured Clostridium sp. TaxID=59620 RepID=UPI0025FF4660|nr:A24 family peptidase [uncultured Clostridium sp.]